MSGSGGVILELTENAVVPSDGQTAEPQIAGSIKPEDDIDEERKEEVGEEEEEEEKALKREGDQEDEDEEEEVTSSARLEPCTLPWPGDRDNKPLKDDADGASEPEERDTGISEGSQELSEKQSQEENDRQSKAKWRESMPEGERWRYHDEIEEQRDDGGDGSQADDEDEGDDDEKEEEDGESHWISEKSALGFTPQVTIVRLPNKEPVEDSRLIIEKDVETEPQVETDSAVQYYQEWPEQDDKYYICEDLCSERLKLFLATLAAGILFPLLVWGGYELLPFDPPLLEGAPIRVVYTLRCAFFAIIPILLGVLVQGAARLRYSSLKPLYEGKLMHKEVAVHWHFVNESLVLFLFYFLQLTVMATYVSQDLVKLVPLLTIIYVFGRLIYWLCLSLGSSVRAFGFSLSFLPILVMLGANLYYVCSSNGLGAVFEVEPPTTAPPKQRWWG